MAKFIPDGAVELYHNNSKKLETTIKGIQVGTGVTMHPHGGVAIAGITTIGGQLLVNSRNNGSNVRFINDTHNQKFYLIWLNHYRD